MSLPTSVDARLAAFIGRELGPNPARARAFGRTLVGLLLVTVAVQLFRPANAYWAVTFVLLVSSPAAGHSDRLAFQRVLAALVGGAIATVLVIGAYDLPWLYVPLQAIGIGVALFLTRATPIGPSALTGGTTFAVITGAAHEIGAAGLVELAWVRLGLAVLGCGLGALAQLTLWPSDPLRELRRSLLADLSAVEARVAGKATALQPGSMSRHFELLAGVEARDPAMVRRRAEISLILLETEALVDRALTEGAREAEARESIALLAAACAQLRRSHESDAFSPPPPAPPPRQPAPLTGILSDNVRLVRLGCMKTALSALVCIVILDTMQLPSSGGLLVCVILGQQLSTGTDVSKGLTLFVMLACTVGVYMLVSRLAGPNVDDFGSYLVVAALAFAPTAWAFSAGPRVRNAGTVSTVLMSVGLLESYRPSDDLGPIATFLWAQSIGCLVVTGIDLGVWPVRRDHAMSRHLAVVMRSTAQLMADLDPRIVLAPGRDPRWPAHRSLRVIADLSGEQDPVPGNPAFARHEEVVRLAAETQRCLVARIEMARRELAGQTSLAETAAQRRAWAEGLSSRADRIEAEGDVLAELSGVGL